jgi:hypothetical protein
VENRLKALGAKAESVSEFRGRGGTGERQVRVTLGNERQAEQAVRQWREWVADAWNVVGWVPLQEWMRRAKEREDFRKAKRVREDVG